MSLHFSGRKRDICKTNNPCMHSGTCIQISPQPGFKCRCEGTGYFGLRCNRRKGLLTDFIITIIVYSFNKYVINSLERNWLNYYNTSIYFVHPRLLSIFLKIYLLSSNENYRNLTKQLSFLVNLALVKGYHYK